MTISSMPSTPLDAGVSLAHPSGRLLQGIKSASSPTVANGVVYIGSNDGHLYAFHLAGTTS